MPALIEVVLPDLLTEAPTGSLLPASPLTFWKGRERTLLLAANNAVNRVLSADSAAFVEQSRQPEGE